MSCVKSHWSGDVDIAVLKQHQAACDIAKSQNAGCLSAITRYCVTRFGQSFTGISQEVGTTSLQVHCFLSTRKEYVRHEVLSSYHSGCRFPYSDSQDCFAAVSRWCSSFGHSGGITQEVNAAYMLVACYNSEFRGDVFVQRTLDFYAAQRRINSVCNLDFLVDQGQILGTTSEILSAKLYDNSQSCVPLTETFEGSTAVTETNSFTNHNNLTYGDGATVSANLPLFAGINITTSTSAIRGVTLTENSKRLSPISFIRQSMLLLVMQLRRG